MYCLFVKAMERSGFAGIGKYVMRDKQHLGCLRVRDSVITLEQMYFADEIRPVDVVSVERVRVGKRELEMASELIDRFSGAFDIDKYRDDYRQALLGVIKTKRKGKSVEVDRNEEPAEAGDLMDALRASLEERRGRNGNHRSTGRASTRKPPKKTKKGARGRRVSNRR